MKILVVGKSAHSATIANMLGTSSPQVEYCLSATVAVDRLQAHEDRFSWVLVSDDVDVQARQRISEAAARAGPPRTIVTLVAPANDEPALDIDGDEPLGESDEELQKWRNVLNFATRTPDSYPALRDAMVTGPAVFQFHAPCKQSA